jgi:two-component system CheB/CheR fusion protein
MSYRPVELRSLIDQAHRERRNIRLSAVQGRGSVSDSEFFDIVVQPLWAADGTSIGTSISFLDTTVQTRLQRDLKQVREDLETAYEELQSTNEELETTNEELQSSIEELETTNEELQSTNEELETTNEELQSTNEELETMNEELQSTNEELETINDELRQRTLDLNEVNSFLESILVSLEAGVVVLDEELRIRAWNDHAAELWGLRSEEAQGQHFVNLDIGLPTDRLLPLVRSTLVGEDLDRQLTVEATNRRGRAIRCRVTCSQLLSPTNEVRGAIVLMEELPAEG